MKILKITISGSFITSSKLSHTISTLDSMACNMEGHIKLIDRLSSPSDQLIHHISHPSKEQTSAKLNVSCFICVQVHGLQLGTCTSVKMDPTLSKVLPKYPLGSKI